MIAALVFPKDRAGSVVYATLAAQVEAGLVRVVQEQRRRHSDRRGKPAPRETSAKPIGADYVPRGGQRRQTWEWPEPLKIMVKT